MAPSDSEDESGMRSASPDSDYVSQLERLLSMHESFLPRYHSATFPLSSSSPGAPYPPLSSQSSLHSLDLDFIDPQRMSQMDRGRSLTLDRLNESPRPFACDFCEWSFKRKEHLERHLVKKHHAGAQVQLFACPFCSHTSDRKDNLRKHVKNAHPDRALPPDLAPTRPGPRRNT